MKPNFPESWPAGRPPAPEMCGEDKRLQILAAHGLDELGEDTELARIAGFAARLCDAPIALVTVVEAEHQRFIARAGLDATQTPRSTSFCAHAMLGSEPMVVEDARADPRFADNPLVVGEPHVRLYAGAPLVSPEGAPLGALCVVDSEPRPGGLSVLQREGLEVLAQAVMRRIGSHRAAIEARQERALEAERLRLMAEHIPVLAWAARPDGSIEFGNSSLYEFFGTDTPEGISFTAMIHADEAPKVEEIRRDAREKGQRWEAEARFRRHDGDYRWVLLRSWPMRNAQGEIETWFGAGIDIDDVHRLSESRDLLARELSHRIKNIFAVVAGLIAIRSRGRPEVAEFAAEINAAIKALGLAHDYVRPVEGRKGDRLLELLRDLLSPYDSGAASRVEVSGDNVAIGARAATPLALIFHELATNSAKYGALSCDEGRIAIAVRDAGEMLEVSWHEQAVPCGVEAQDGGSTEGFGSRLLRMAVEGQLDGKFSRRFDEGGLAIELTVPRARITG